MQQEPEILDRGGAARRQHEQAVEAALEGREQLGDDLGLVAEVIVEIARADLHLVGDVRRRDVWLAKPVEQLERGLDDALACAAGAFALRHGRAAPLTPRAWRARPGTKRARRASGPAHA